MANSSLRQLIDGYITQNISPAEKQRLFALLQDDSADAELQSIMDEQWAAGLFTTDEDPQLRELIFRRIQERMTVPAPVRKMWNWKRWAVAASIIITIATIAYLVIPGPTKSGEEPIVKSNDVQAPTTTKATITLADGRIIALDSLNTINQNGVQLVKTAEGRLIYTPSTVETSTAVYNTLSNPRGSKVIDLALADGSHVWLNAGSSVTYPIAFVGNQRKVHITGEAYFEIAHDKSQPFTVSKGDMNVQVLGTKFNVNAYDDESEIKVTLLEGSVKVSNDVDSKTIKPGQQARVSPSSPLGVGGVDVDAVLAWKNGRFEFSGQSIEAIMRQVARWYDVEVVYEGKAPNEQFMGGTSRQENISALLKVLEATNKIHFRVEGRKVYVLK